MVSKILIILSLLFILFCGTVFYVVYKSLDANQSIARNVAVSSEWIEFSPQVPMKVNKQTQSVVFRINGYKYDSSEKGWQEKIKLPDGTIISPEVQILDEYGNAYDLRFTGTVNNDICFTPKLNLETNTTFPKDRVYTKVRVRSAMPFEISEIMWRNRNLK